MNNENCIIEDKSKFFKGGEDKMIGTQDLIIVAVIVVVLFGARKLPELGKGLGQSIRDFKKAMKEEPDAIDVTPKKDSSDKEETQKKEKE